MSSSDIILVITSVDDDSSVETHVRTSNRSEWNDEYLQSCISDHVVYMDKIQEVRCSQEWQPIPHVKVTVECIYGSHHDYLYIDILGLGIGELNINFKE